jgi:hypothetical protein
MEGAIQNKKGDTLMTRRFEYNLPIRRYLPLFLGLYIPAVLLYILLIAQTLRLQDNPGNPVGLLVLLLAFVLFFVLYTLLYIPILRVTIPALSLEGKQFGFRGSMGRWFGMNLLGCFLTIITLGIYGAWYVTRITRYITEETSFDGKPFAFKGRGGTLFLIVLLTLAIPMAVVVALSVVATLAQARADSPGAMSSLWAPTCILSTAGSTTTSGWKDTRCGGTPGSGLPSACSWDRPCSP